MKQKKQLKMCYLRHEPTLVALPDGYKAKLFDGSDEERIIYTDICRNGLSKDSDGKEWFVKEIDNHHNCVPTKDVFFIMHGEEYVAGITAIFNPNSKQGYVHMVSVRNDYRGKGLAAPLNYLAVKKLYDEGAKYIILTTNDWRVAAVKSYLKAGFLPMVHGVGLLAAKKMADRWEKIYRELGKKELVLLSHFRKPLIKRKIEL